jgi:hypothetical protein
MKDSTQRRSCNGCGTEYDESILVCPTCTGPRAYPLPFGHPLSVAELLDKQQVLGWRIGMRSTLLSELVIARRVWRSHRALVEQAEPPFALADELTQLRLQRDKINAELDFLDPCPF